MKLSPGRFVAHLSTFLGAWVALNGLALIWLEAFRVVATANGIDVLGIGTALIGGGVTGHMLSGINETKQMAILPPARSGGP